jgi:diguanylate cyclase (GGDEF)-like protein
MEVLSFLETNILAIIILLIIFFNLREQSEKYKYDQKLFVVLICSNVIILVLDSILWMLNGQPGQGARILNILLTSVYFIANPLPCLLWSVYVNYQIFHSAEQARAKMLFLLIPVGLNTLLSLVSCFSGIYFYFDDFNVYHRGKLFLLMAAICYLYLFSSVIYVIMRRKQVQKRYYIPLISFAILPIIGGILQTTFYGISLVWICMAVSILIIFINVQNNRLSTDYLTGLCNRRQLDNYLNDLVESNSHGLLAGIMIDLDSFKKINDSYGHTVGDQALENAAKILKKSFRKNDMIARYGGDEFIVVFETDQKTDLAKAVHRIKENVRLFNSRENSPYQIEFSIGYDIFNFKSNRTIQQFLNHIDELMYLDKKSKKNRSSFRDKLENADVRDNEFQRRIVE